MTMTTTQNQRQEGLFARGISRVEELLGEDVRDYDRALAGLVEVLRGEGLEIDTNTLHDLFHYPLASYTIPPSTLSDLRSGLDNALEGVKASRWQEQILSGFALPPGTEASPVEDEESLRRKIRELERHLGNPAARGSLAQALDQAEADNDRLAQQVDVVDTLYGGQETDRTRACSELIARVRAAAETRILTASETLEETRERLAGLPSERARSLRPVQSLRVKQSAFPGNYADPACGYIATPCFMIKKQAVSAKKLDPLTCRKPTDRFRSSAISSSTCEETFQRAVAEATSKARLLGYIEHSRDRLALLVEPQADGYRGVYLSADLLKFVLSCLRGGSSTDDVEFFFAPLESPCLSRPVFDPVVLRLGGSPVAVVMPVRHDLSTIPLAVEEALAALATSESEL